MSEWVELPTVLFKTPDEFAMWLDAHVDAPGVWVQIAKKNSGAKSVSYAEAVDVAICYGWIDSLVHGLDDKFYLTKFSPRKPKGNWTVANQQKAEAFMAAGLMKPSGLKAIEQAKQNGKWSEP